MIRLLLPKTNSATCRSCGAAIDWYETPAGKKMPMNAGAVSLRITGGGPQPEIGEFDAADSHFVTCPTAAAWRKTR
jgi:hypothetical protein